MASARALVAVWVVVNDFAFGSSCSGRSLKIAQTLEFDVDSGRKGGGRLGGGGRGGGSDRWAGTGLIVEEAVECLLIPWSHS